MNVNFKDLGNDNSLKIQVYKNIKSMIINGHLKPKERLLEESLSKAMNVSRAPIREALNRLEKEGFVKIFPRRGAVVSDISIHDVEEIFEIREALEVLAITQSMPGISIKELENIICEMKKIENNSNEEQGKNDFLSLDKAFHKLIRKNCHNRRVKQILENLQEHMKWLRSIAYENISINQSIREHILIFEAIKRSDKELVKERLSNHLIRAKKSLLDSKYLSLESRYTDKEEKKGIRVNG